MGARTACVLGFAVAFCLVLVGCSSSVRRVVNVGLNANWASSPLLLEASEYFAEEGNDYFWRFVDAIAAAEPAATEEGQYKQALHAANELLSPVSFALLNFSLSLRYYSPRVEMYRQYAAQLPQFARVEGSWAQVGADSFYTVESLKSHLQGNPERQTLEDVLSKGVDSHVFPASAKQDSPVVLLYSHLGTREFASFHEFLSEEAKKENIVYVLRHCPRYSAEQARTPLTVQGYGVELAIKSMEYKAIDDSRVSAEGTTDFQAPVESQEQEVEGFLFSKLVQRKPHLGAELESFKDHLMLNMQENEGFDQLKAWQVKDLGFQAAQRIVLAAEPLVQLRDLCQNFPLIASSLSRLRINETIKATLEKNSEYFQGAGLNFLYMNGQLLDAATDAFTLFARIRQEIKKSDSLKRFGIGSTEGSKVMSLVTTKKSAIIDIRDPEPEDNQVVQFLNDIETDPAFSHWPSNIYSLLQPAMPGQFRFIRKNIFSCILAIDPARQPDLVALDTITSMLDRGLPIRLGIILLTPSASNSTRSTTELSAKDLEMFAAGNFGTSKEHHPAADEEHIAEDDPSVAVFKAFWHVRKVGSLKSAFTFLSKLLRASVERAEQGLIGAETLYETLAKHLKLKRHTLTHESWEDIKKNDYNSALRRTREFAVAKGLVAQKGTISFFVNGELTPLTYENQYFQINMQIRKMVFYGYSSLIEGLQAGEVTADTNIYDYLLSRPGTYPRYNPTVFGDSETFISMVDHATTFDDLKYFSNTEGEFEVKLHSHVLVLDISSVDGAQAALQALLRLVQLPKETTKVRVAFLHNGVESAPLAPADQEFSLHFALMAAAELPPKKSLPFAIRLLSTALLLAKEKNLERVSLSMSDVSSILKDTTLWHSDTQFSVHYASYLQSVKANILQRQQLFAADTLKLSPGQKAIITNGRLLRLEEQDTYSFADFALLEEYERVNHVQDIYDALKDIQHEGIDPDDLTSEFFSNELATVVSLLGEDGTKGVRKMVFPPEVSPTFIATPKGSESGSSRLTITAVLDPLSKSTQSITPLLLTLVESLGVTVGVVLNPKSDLSDIPLKNFYRFVLQDGLKFDSAGMLATDSDSGATFTNLPTKQLLTLNMDTPRTWLVQPVAAVYDLDNIRLGEMGDDHLLSARFKLEHILAEGNCADVSNGNQPPTGLQLNIGTSSLPHIQDTVVMSNLGYFQLQTNPGVWQLSIAPGRHSRVYSVLTPRGHEHVSSLPIVVRDFVPSFHEVQVQRNAGMESEALLVPGEEDDHAAPVRSEPSLWESLTSFWGEKPEAVKQPEKVDAEAEKPLETINIFSVASGHLYERFLKIMMLSVVKNTKSPVKFWFVKNFLSPKFKQMLPALSKELNCSIELVTYKWPSWLHQETEKQRVIWGYKILFLDVLFPLHVKKIVYVDADQVVRADMKELVELDLHGAPYGYTPFCSSRTEMDGYRFWKDGYWKSHLGDKPYHISALYVVDLVRFRSMGAGDQLRTVYHQFSSDQNSLSNLDQDLPNYLQNSVPIFSLPQHWLWCETWCDDASKPAAKTIDLCNNPLTKTPKLENAMRIVPEWVDLDNTIKSIEKTFYSGDQEATNEPQHQNLDDLSRDIL